MQTCDSVIQNRCWMQGKSVFGGIRSTECLGEILLIWYLYINDTREKDEKNVLTSAGKKESSRSSSISGSPLL